MSGLPRSGKAFIGLRSLAAVQDAASLGSNSVQVFQQAVAKQLPQNAHRYVWALPGSGQPASASVAAVGGAKRARQRTSRLAGRRNRWFSKSTGFGGQHKGGEASVPGTGVTRAPFHAWLAAGMDARIASK